MKKACILVSILFLLPLFLFGAVSALDRDATVSVTENRRLATFPRPSRSGLVDGSWSADLDTYYTDTFPLREKLLKLERQLNRFYVFSPGGGSGEDVSLVLPFGQDQVAAVEIGGGFIEPPEIIKKRLLALNENNKNAQVVHGDD